MTVTVAGRGTVRAPGTFLSRGQHNFSQPQPPAIPRYASSKELCALGPRKLWIGRVNKDMTDKYAAQLKKGVEWHKGVAEKTGLGFALPLAWKLQLGNLGNLQCLEAKKQKQHKSN